MGGLSKTEGASKSFINRKSQLSNGQHLNRQHNGHILTLFEVPKPLSTLGIGVDAIPKSVKESVVFDGNDLGKLGNIEALPTTEEVSIFVKQNFSVKGVLSADDMNKLHLEAKKYLDENDVLSAWKVLLAEK